MGPTYWGGFSYYHGRFTVYKIKQAEVLMFARSESKLDEMKQARTLKLWTMPNKQVFISNSERSGSLITSSAGVL